MTFNLIHNIDVPATEAKITAYADQNAQDIAQNKALSAQDSASAEAQFAAQKEEARLRREAARREEDDERRERAEGRREIIDKIATSTDDPDKIIRESQKVVLKKSTARRTAAEKAQRQQQQQDAAIKVDNGAPAYTIAGLKAPPPAPSEPEKAYDPFAGYVLKSEYHSLESRYENPWFEKGLKTDPKITAGGYDVGEYCARAMVEAFAGLGVFVEDEVARREEVGNAVVGTDSAAVAAAAAGGERG